MHDPRFDQTDHEKRVDAVKKHADNVLRHRLAANVRAARTRAGLTGGELARLMRTRGHKWDAAQVSRVERAGRPITAEALGDLAAILCTTADRLLNEE